MRKRAFDADNHARGAEMLLAIVIGWVAASVSLYAYLFVTAEECDSAYCFDCRELCCQTCPFVSERKLAA